MRAVRDRKGDRVHGEVAPREIAFDLPVHRREVHRAIAVQSDAPRRVLLGERERKAA